MMNKSVGNKTAYASTSLYVGNLSPETTEQVLCEFLNAVAPVDSIRVCRDSSTRKSLCYGYVNFHTIGDAERALETLNYSPILGYPCRLMWSQRDPAVRKSPSGNLFVKNLDKSVDHRTLYDTFSLFGNILSCKVESDEKGMSKGYGFVHFETDEAAATAIEKVNGMKIGGKEVFVGVFCSRNERVSGKTEFFTNLYVRSFPNTWTEDNLRKLFAPFGEITSLWLSADKQGRPFSCIAFSDTAAAKAAKGALHGKRFDHDGVMQSPAKESTKQDDQSGEVLDIAAKQTDTGSSTAGTTESAPTAEEKSAETRAKTEIAGEAAEAKGNVAAKEASKDATATEAAAETAVEKKTASAETTEATAPLVKAVKSFFTLHVDRAQDRSEREQAAKQRLETEAAFQKGKPAEGTNLYIKHLPDTMEDEALATLFGKYGTVSSAKIMRDEDGNSKGFGFVCFARATDAAKAISDLHLQDVGGKPLYVAIAESKEKRQARLQHHFRGKAAVNRGFGGPGGPGGPGGAGRASFGAPAAYYPAMAPGVGPNAMSAVGNFVHAGLHPNGAPPMAMWPMQSNMWKAQQAPGAYMGGPQQGVHRIGGPGAGAGPRDMMHREAAMRYGGPSQADMFDMMQRMDMMRGAGVVHASQMPGGMASGAGGSMGMGPGHGMHASVGGMYRGPGPLDMSRGAHMAQQSGGLAAQQSVSGPNTNAPGPRQTDSSNGGLDLRQAIPARMGPSTHMHKQYLGERLFPLVSKHQPTLAGKITGMMLDMDEDELVNLIHSEAALKGKVDEAVRVLEQASQRAADQHPRAALVQ